MEVAIKPAYHQPEFPSQISAMDAAAWLIDPPVEASLKRFEDAETWKYILKAVFMEKKTREEDILDTCLIEVADPAEKKDGLLKRLQKNIADLLNKKRKALHTIAVASEDTKKRLQEVADRRDRFSVAVALPAPATKPDPRLADMHKEAAQLIGIDNARAELIAMLQPDLERKEKKRKAMLLPASHGDADSDVSGSSSREMKIVSVVGVGGLGKTTLAKAVYHELQSQYDCGAFVPIGRTPQVFSNILYLLDKKEYSPILNLKDQFLLIGELQKFLQNKRDFIVIDDVWDITTWNIIKSALVNNDTRSRVITTTHNRDVASRVGEVPPEQLDPQVRLWASEVWEASYDMEDILDTCLIEVADPVEKKDGLLKRLHKNIADLLKKSKARHTIAVAIKDMKKRLQEVADCRDRFSVAVALPAPAPQEYLNVSLSPTASVPAVKGPEFIRTGTVKKRGKVEVALDKMDTLLCFEYMQKANLYKLDLQTRFNIEGEQGQQARKMRSCGFGDDGDGGIKFVEETKKEGRSTGLAHLMLLLMVEAVCSKISEMSPEEFYEIVICQEWWTTWKFESSSKQIKRLNQIVLSCLETGKSTKATSSTVSSTQRAVHDILILAAISIITEMKPLLAYDITAPNMDSVDLVLDFNGLTLAAALSVHQHNLTDEQSDKPRSYRAAATNSSEATTRAPMANMLTDDEAENQSDPNSCVAERDTIEEEKRSGEWFVATGAAHHATWKRDLFSNLVDVENDGLCVHAADGTPMPVCGRGDVVTDDVVLPDVYYVPRLCTNLVSVGQLAGLDYCVGFGRGACVISSAAGTVVGRAHARGDGLYEVDFLRVPLGMP
ncbi:uncharacterized protein [Setaria viridis]|uniref:Uncharacterized protein n=1 Tax=Setaria viridis TaxID=4556 RepID=A0A4U6TXB5_SETVI|nr:uncharacterized protein LOC117866242 isoform X2 [Setaria viridis]TKW02427.1 hypothetical protein SEVIR_8G243400v2 [Setaria viridis]